MPSAQIRQDHARAPRADEFKGAWTAIGRVSPDRLTSLRRVATIESIGSLTRIEGASCLTKRSPQKARLEKRIDRERLILGDLPELSVRILELCRERRRITVAEAEKATGANRSTIKDHLKALSRAGHIAQHGAGRRAWYGLA